MTGQAPAAELDRRYSTENAAATDWAEARERFADAGVYWISTVRPDGRPHVTPLNAVWLDDAAFFCTGPDEQKAANIGLNAHCVLTTGCNHMEEGLDVVIEGDAVRASDDGTLRRVAAEYESKYGGFWHFTVKDGVFHHGPGIAVVYRVAPARAFAFGRGEAYSQTRWRFDRG